MKIALCTTFYPGVEPFLRDWYRSVLRQTDPDYHLWIALDAIEPNQAIDAIGTIPEANWVKAEKDDTPALVRQRVLLPIIEQYDAVVLVDSDDILHPNRIANARLALGKYELVACALRLVDAHGKALNAELNLPSGKTPDTTLPRHNIFGFSNTAWRCELLKRCMPIPGDVEIVDWFLATRAWLLGANIAFDSTVAMDYRQHESNMTQVRAPFDHAQVKRDTERARHHFRIVKSSSISGTIKQRVDELESVARDIEMFAERILSNPARFDHYLRGLNSLKSEPLWWLCVAPPALKHHWSD